MKAEIKCTKRAWIRDTSVPVGKPAQGRINCPCGNAPLTDFNAAQGNIICDCGIEYTWNGYVVYTPTPTIQERMAKAEPFYIAVNGVPMTLVTA